MDMFSPMNVEECHCGNVIVSLGFINVMNRIITIIALLFFHLHLFDKLKTEPRPTLFLSEPTLSGQLSYTPMWPLNRSSTVLVFN